MDWNLGNVDKNKVKEISGCNLDEIKKILKGKLDYKKIWMRDTIPPFYYYDAKKLIFEDIWLMEPSIIDSVTLRIKQLERRMDEASYRTKYALMDKRLRIPALISEYEKIPDDELYDVFSFVYRASEYGFELFTKDMIKQIKSRVPIEQATPSSYENEDKIIVYRGIGSKSNVDGFSWTTDSDIAIYFAKRLGFFTKA